MRKGCALPGLLASISKGATTAFGQCRLCCGTFRIIGAHSFV